ncbi:uncharacterized protein LOC108347847 isoform X1 [Vigna angularis]|uniref:uncharacterized protein LOC108347847 isoform X1 n=1 Tax=Phaseolus angularis TaxID=3914 RepID=UPI0022B55468|nr:uncharacterized protein LOC108347847 isoform X1 [Vigna angularis]XP_052733628.1 uncharacterized protein LOC108347847 isoform X1 [Vigna angularis]XP_052733630.1 uncharacterized protein LOC108347847 isoform X1 [Vigna angularis]
MFAGSSNSSSNRASHHGSDSSKFDLMKAFQQMQHQLDFISKRLDKDAKAKGEQPHGHDHGSYKKKQEARTVNVYLPSPKKHQEDKAIYQGLTLPKLNLPTFKGEAEPSIFLDWIAKVDQIFYLYSVNGPLCVKLACLALEGYAKQWLNRRYLTMASTVSTWEHCSDILYQHFVPSYYHRDLLIKLQRLTQGRRSVEEYAHELEVLLHRTNLKETNHAKIVRFISGLNSNIQDIIEIHNDETLDVVVHRAMKVEKKLLKKEACHNKFSKSSTNVLYKSSSSKDKTKDVSKEPTNKSCPHSSSNHSSSLPKSPSRPSHIKCFKCLGHGHIASACPTKKATCIEGEVIMTNESTSSLPSPTYNSSSSSSDAKEKVMLTCLNEERKEREEREKKEKEELVREMEKDKVLVKKEVLLKAPSTPIIQIDPSHDRGAFQSFYFSPFTKFSLFVPKVFFTTLSPSSFLLSNYSINIFETHHELVLPLWLHSTQDKNNFFSKNGLLVFTTKYNKNIRRLSFTNTFFIYIDWST